MKSGIEVFLPLGQRLLGAEKIGAHKIGKPKTTGVEAESPRFQESPTASDAALYFFFPLVLESKCCDLVKEVKIPSFGASEPKCRHLSCFGEWPELLSRFNR